MKKILLFLICTVFIQITTEAQLSNLIPINTATHTAVQSGSWFTASNWSTGTVPSDASIVVIPNGITIDYQGQSTAHIFAIRVDGIFNCTQTSAIDTTSITFDTFIGTMGSFVKFKANGVTDGEIDVTITPFDIEAHKSGTSGYTQVWNANAIAHFSDGTPHYEVTYNIASTYRYKTYADALADNSANATAITEATRTSIDDGTGILGRTGWDATQLSIGLITMGQIEINGQEKLEMSKLSTDANKNQNQVQLLSIPTGWKVGDEILVTRGGNMGTPSNGEDVKTIQSITGTTITTATNLNKNHIGRPSDNLHCYVGNLTRNITFKSGDTSDVHHRAHFMQMMNPSNVQIRNAAFINMGRTDKSKVTDDFTWDKWVQPPTFKSFNSPLGQECAELKLMPAQDISNIRGRYSIHLHRMGVTDGTNMSFVTGNVVWGNPGWGITQHHSTAEISKNVIYDVTGAGLVSESGSEQGFWDNNLIVKMEAGHSLSPYKAAIYYDDYLYQGQGLGMKGRAIICRNNVIAKAVQGVGIMNMNPSKTNLDRVDPVALANRPGYEVDNFPLDVNGYSSEGDGVMPVEAALILENTTTIWCNDGLKSIERDMGVNHESRSVFDGFICWGTGIGFRITYQTDYTFKDVFISGKNATSFGIYMWKHSHNHYFERIKFADLAYAVTVSKLVENGTQPKKIRNNGFTPWYFIDATTENVPNFYKIEKEDIFTPTIYDEHGDNPIHLSATDLVPRLTTFTILDSTELSVDVGAGDFRFEIDGIITDQSGSYNMGIRQSLAQGNLREGYPERIYEFASQAKFESYLTANGIYKDVNDGNQLYFIINEALPDRRDFQYTTFPVRVKIMNAPTSGLYASPLIEPVSNFDPTYQIVSRFATVSQSSTNMGITLFGGAIDVSATKAVDGNNNGRKNVNQYQDGLLPVGSWSETNTELEPWYDLDLGEVKSLKYIELWNTVGLNGSDIETMGLNFKNFHVMVSDTPFAIGATLAQSLALADYSYLKNGALTRKFSLNNLDVDGRYIRIQAIGTTKLEFAEVEVVGKSFIICSQPDTTLIALESCNPLDVGVVVDSLVNILTCDSFVITTTTLLPISTNTINTTSCNSVDVGTVSDTLVNALGCDSILTTVTTLLASSANTINTTSCNPLNVGTVSDTLVNALGCDSILTTITTLLASSANTINTTSCNPLNVGTVSDTLVNALGCDSILTTVTTLLASSANIINTTSCNPLNVGTVSDTLVNALGCDSIIITVTVLDVVVATITEVSGDLFASPVGLNYQWLDCDNNYAPIVGATSNSYTPTASSNYAVVITNTNCNDTSNCLSVIVTGVHIYNNETNKINIYPNPTEDKVTINFNFNFEQLELRLENNLGQLVKTYNVLSTNKMVVDMNDLSKGIYFIHLLNEGTNMSIKVIKQ